MRAWDHMRRGDLVRWNGRLRKIRAVTRRSPPENSPLYGRLGPYGRFHSAQAVILRCSWTRKPTTIFSRSDCSSMFGGIVQRNVSLHMTDLESRLQQWIDRLHVHFMARKGHNCFSALPSTSLQWFDVCDITCRDVVDAGLI